jgi:hypothetical protein
MPTKSVALQEQLDTADDDAATTWEAPSAWLERASDWPAADTTTANASRY